MIKPEGCTANYAPVCGCDQVTYSNDCVRRAAGVSRLAEGVCTGSASDGGVDHPATDAGTATCMAPAACQGLTPPHRCAGDWSCLDGRCVYECFGGARTCQSQTNGCVACVSARPAGSTTTACPGTACVVTDLRPTQVESTTCQVPAALSGGTCFGSWLRLEDGRLCSVIDAATSLPRWAVNCESCTTVVTQ